jgi:hypothetical protein
MNGLFLQSQSVKCCFLYRFKIQCIMCFIYSELADVQNSSFKLIFENIDIIRHILYTHLQNSSTGSGDLWNSNQLQERCCNGFND